MNRALRLALFLALGLTSCRCKPGPVTPLELGLRVEPAEVDFWRALAGDTRTATEVLTASKRAEVSV